MRLILKTTAAPEIAAGGAVAVAVGAAVGPEIGPSSLIHERHLQRQIHRNRGLGSF